MRVEGRVILWKTSRNVDGELTVKVAGHVKEDSQMFREALNLEW
jgi:hypothetical protein